ncbi:NEW3 domain-containing protein [Chitinophaga horti]|uniref:NEW3 domain-containing protein n=1 Tax=Chitinophaga horti TaxID=2920382 RepID=A0ABY6J846_9BACT|nr:NEW3 domain-containing protein [Chitinophaga horti]UYQ95772.1 NEW3 domain-containing protein [Chitinophaga horti]
MPGSFTARLMNLEATSKETFRFSATLHNAAPRPVIYNFSAAAPSGWNLMFRVDGMQVTSFRADSGRTQEVSIELTPAPEAKPGKYTVPVHAVSNTDTLLLQLEAVVKGAYAMELTTPNGLLSGEITEGSRKAIHLTVKNTGTLPLDAVEVSAQAPSKWDATFEPAKIERIEPGKSVDVVANLNVPDKTIAGDYVTTFTARNNSVNASAMFRMTVTTSLLAGWIGVVIILAAIAIIYLLIKKYGRR